MAIEQTVYETTLVTRSAASEESHKNIKDKMKKTIKDFDGEVVFEDDWGKRKFAYPLKKEQRGQYDYFVYTGKPGVISEVERMFRIQDDVIRFLTVVRECPFDEELYKKERGLNHRERDKDRDDHRRGGRYRSEY